MTPETEIKLLRICLTFIFLAALTWGGFGLAKLI